MKNAGWICLTIGCAICTLFLVLSIASTNWVVITDHNIHGQTYKSHKGLWRSCDNINGCIPLRDELAFDGKVLNKEFKFSEYYGQVRAAMITACILSFGTIVLSFVTVLLSSLCEGNPVKWSGYVITILQAFVAFLSIIGLVVYTVQHHKNDTAHVFMEKKLYRIPITESKWRYSRGYIYGWISVLLSLGFALTALWLQHKTAENKKKKDDLQHRLIQVYWN